MHVLYVDDCMDSSLIIEREAKKLGIKITLAKSMDDAKTRVGNQKLTAQICDPKLISGYSFNNEIKTSFVFATLPDIDSLQELKKSKQIDYAAAKPSSPEEAHYLLSKMCQIKNSMEPACDWLDEIPPKLMNDYLRSTYEKLSSIANLIHQAKRNPSPEIFQSLKFIVHKVAGSAGLYGRGMASELCKQFEIRLNSSESISNFELDSFYRQLFLYIQ